VVYFLQKTFKLGSRRGRDCRSIYNCAGVRAMVFNDTFNNISVISWWSVLLVEETVASHSQTLYLKFSKILLDFLQWKDSIKEHLIQVCHDIEKTV
jgi:hypothetical protein